MRTVRERNSSLTMSSSLTDDPEKVMALIGYVANSTTTGVLLERITLCLKEANWDVTPDSSVHVTDYCITFKAQMDDATTQRAMITLADLQDKNSNFVLDLVDGRVTVYIPVSANLGLGLQSLARKLG